MRYPFFILALLLFGCARREAPEVAAVPALVPTSALAAARVVTPAAPGGPSQVPLPALPSSAAPGSPAQPLRQTTSSNTPPSTNVQTQMQSQAVSEQERRYLDMYTRVTTTTYNAMRDVKEKGLKDPAIRADASARLKQAQNEIASTVAPPRYGQAGLSSALSACSSGITEMCAGLEMFDRAEQSKQPDLYDKAADHFEKGAAHFDVAAKRSDEAVKVIQRQ